MTTSRRPTLDALTGLIPIRILVPLLLAIFVIIVGLWNYGRHRKTVDAGIEREAIRVLRLEMTRLQAGLEEAARTGNSTWMQEQVAAFGADTHGLIALLVDESGKVMASANRGHIGQLVEDTLPRQLQGEPFYQLSQLLQTRSARAGSVAVIGNGDLVVGRYPILLGSAQGELRPSRIGVALVASNLSVLKSQALSGVRGEAFRISLVLLALGAGTSLLLHFLVTRRLARISRAANQLATGDLSARSGVDGRDEIALLGQSFDSMVTDLKQHAGALVESEERHRSLFENAVEGIVTMGEDRLILSANPAAQKMFGYTEEELIGENVKILMPSPYHEEHDGYVRNYVNSGKKKIIGIGREVTGKHKKGHTFPLELSVAELKLTHERIFMGILRDITDRKLAEDELQKMNEHLEELVLKRTKDLEDAQENLVRQERLATLGQLAGSVAHEVRNPLGIVRNATYFLEQTTKNPDQDTRSSYEEIRRGLTRADRIIAELLDYARDPQASQEKYLLKDAITRSTEGISIPVNVSVNLPSPLPTSQCCGDLSQVSQILNNLIVNAIQAMPEGGAVMVECVTKDGEAVLNVSDSGQGMTEDQLGKIFEPLFTTKTRGIGLGLALSRRYAELNRGTLTATSTPGEGSTFRLTIPIITD